MRPRDPYLAELAERGFHDADAERFSAVWERLESCYLERLAAVTAPLAGWRARFRAAAAETALLVEACPAEARFLAVDSFGAGDLGHTCRHRLATRLAAMADTARSELAEPELVPEATASLIVAMFFARINRHCTQPGGPGFSSQLPELRFLAVSLYFGTEAGHAELVPPA